MQTFNTDRMNSIINTLTGMALVGETDHSLLRELQDLMIKLDEYIEAQAS